MPVTDRLVLDASVAVKASLVDDGFAPLLERGFLAAPTLAWSEVASAVSQLRWRAELDDDEAVMAIQRFLDAPIHDYPSRDLLHEAAALAHRLGWAKTYDAEYVILARRLDARLITLDARLRAQASSVVTVLGPLEIL